MPKQNVPSGGAKPQLLEFIGTVTIPAMTQFVAREKFVVRRGVVKIAWLSSNFQEWFLEKVEESAAETILRYAELIQAGLDESIMTELGICKETTLAVIYAIMERQPNGGEGALLNNGQANIFYARDINDVLRTVCIYWDRDGWDVNAQSVEDLSMWAAGRRVFSCNS